MAGALVAIGAAGALGLFLTDLPRWACLALAPVVAGWGVQLARRSLGQPSMQLLLRGDGQVEVDRVRVDGLRLQWRGPLTRLEWRRDGRRVRWLGGPDVLGVGERRELRLWAIAHAANASTSPVAP